MMNLSPCIIYIIIVYLQKMEYYERADEFPRGDRDF